MAGVGGRELLLLGACLLAALAFSLASPHFATVENGSSVLRNSVELLLLGLGLTLLLAMGSIDVSVGVATGLAAVLVGKLVAAGAPAPVAVVAGPLAGLALGAVAGALVVLGRVPAIVGTLGLFGLYRSAMFGALGGQWLSGLPSTLTEALGIAPLGLPLVVWVVALAYACAWVALRRLSFGPHLFAIGQSVEKARLAGVPIVRTSLAAFLASGLLCGIAATFYVAAYRNVEPTTGATLALDAIAAVVLGGTSVLGGRASLLGTALGVLLIRILQNGLLLVGVPSLWQTVVTGAVLLVVLVGERAVASGASSLVRTSRHRSAT